MNPNRGFSQRARRYSSQKWLTTSSRLKWAQVATLRTWCCEQVAKRFRSNGLNSSGPFQLMP